MCRVCVESYDGGKFMKHSVEAFKPIRCPLLNDGCKNDLHKPFLKAGEFAKIFGENYPDEAENYGKLVTEMYETPLFELMNQGKWTRIWKINNEHARGETPDGYERETTKTCPKCSQLVW